MSQNTKLRTKINILKFGTKNALIPINPTVKSHSHPPNN